MSADAERRRQELEAELAALERQEREQAEQQRLQEQAERDARLDPELREQKDAIERLADAALEREYPPAWLPQKASENNHPDRVVGLVLRIDPRVGPSPAFGTYSAVVEVRATDGREWTLWCNEGGALYQQLLRLRLQPGEVVAAQYRGKRESQRNPGQSYQDFRLVRVDDGESPAAPVDYDALQRGQEAAALPPPADPPEPDDIPF